MVISQGPHDLQRTSLRELYQEKEKEANRKRWEENKKMDSLALKAAKDRGMDREMAHKFCVVALQFNR